MAKKPSSLRIQHSAEWDSHIIYWLSFAHLLDRWLNDSKTRQNEGMQSNILTSLIESNPIKPKSLCEPLGLFTLNKSVVHSVNPIADCVHPLGPHMKNEHQSTRL